MRQKKIRGNRKRLRLVSSWVHSNTDLNVDYLESSKRQYCKIWVDPWETRISLLNSDFPQPKGKIRKEIIKGLVTIYNSWEKTLTEMGKPFYLKIWLNDPYISRSQIVCAIDNCLHFYDNTFHEVTSNLNKMLSIKGADNFEWTQHFDEYSTSQSEIDSENDVVILKSLLETKNKSHRKLDYQFEGLKDTAYFKKVGYVWVGSKKKSMLNS